MQIILDHPLENYKCNRLILFSQHSFSSDDLQAGIIFLFEDSFYENFKYRWNKFSMACSNLEPRRWTAARSIGAGATLFPTLRRAWLNCTFTANSAACLQIISPTNRLRSHYRQKSLLIDMTSRILNENLIK